MQSRLDGAQSRFQCGGRLGSVRQEGCDPSVLVCLSVSRVSSLSTICLSNLSTICLFTYLSVLCLICQSSIIHQSSHLSIIDLSSVFLTKEKESSLDFEKEAYSS